MIGIGYTDAEKRETIARYQAEHAIRQTIVISADDFPLHIPGAEAVDYSQVIMYVTFYRLLQEITPDTLLVLNECLRTQNRYDLAYNCIRNYLNMTTHQLIFQQLPQIDTREDFMVLFDWDTRSRWKRQHFDADLIRDEALVDVRPLPLRFEAVPVPTSKATQNSYAKEREKLIAELQTSNRDPHILPRRLYLLGGKDKRDYIDKQTLPLFDQGAQYVARNKRLGRDAIVTYSDAQPGQQYTIVELPHRFIEFADFIKTTGQTTYRVLVADLKVDQWYFSRYQEWAERIHDTYTSLSA
jgi:hypothetical protein